MKGWLILAGVAIVGYFLLLGMSHWIRSSARKAAVNDYEVVVIDHCEYVLISGYNQIAIAHKGNCKNH